MGTLKNLVIAVTGTLEHDVTQLRKWIEANGGRYSPNVRIGVTHLIAGKDAWKQASDAVQAAIKLGAFVVEYEWLEEGLLKGRKLAERKYTWEYITQQKRREREIRRLGPLMSTKQFNEGCEEVKKTAGTGTSRYRRSRAIARKLKKSTSILTADMHVPFVSAAEDLKRRRKDREAATKKVDNAESSCATLKAPSMAQSSTSITKDVSFAASASLHALSTTSHQPTSPAPELQAKKPSLKDLYHYYLDTTGFEYKIILTRCNLRANEITRYRLSILESHTKPHVYCTFIEYFPPGVGNTASLGDTWIQALLDFDQTFHEGAAPGMDTFTSTNEGEEDQANTLPAPLPLPQEGVHTHLEAARLRSLLLPSAASPTPPPPDRPYKTLLAPMGSTFATPWRTFRHAFRDLTLLSWEERFDVSKKLYKERASYFDIEPFVYVRPKHGLPLGLRTQQDGLFQNQALTPLAKDGSIVSADAETAEIKENDDAYMYNAFNLPGLSHPLGPGIVGHAVQRDIKSAREATEKAKQLADEAEEARLKKLGLARKVENKKKPNYSRPLFNGVNGRPTMDAWGRYKRGEGGAGGVHGSGLLGGGVVKRQNYKKPWSYETGAL